MITCAKKAWHSKDPTKLVGDGDESATALFARAGLSLPESSVEKFTNAADFFSGIETKTPLEEEPEEEQPSKRRKH